MRWTLVEDERGAPILRAADGDPVPPPGPAPAAEDCPDGQHWDPEANDGEGGCVPDVEGEAPAENANRFHTLLVPEGTMSGDARFINEGVLTWRDLPLPFMGLDTTTEMHDQAVVVGSIDRIEREGNLIHGYGTWASTAEANDIRALVRDGHLRGVSVDMDDVEFDLVFPETDGEEEGLLILAAAGDTEVPEGEVIDLGPQPVMVVKQGRIMGATIVPFPAFQEAFVEDLDPTAPLHADAVTAAGVRPVPVDPPRAWFDRPTFARYTPLHFGDDGRVIGHVAAWDSCHLSFPDQCVPPPRSATDYAYFHVGEVRCSNGERVAVGHIALKGGHAPLGVSPSQAQAHYDDTRSCIADVVAGEDRFGVFVVGALRPNARPEDVRAAMASGVSGDWRRIGASMELIHLSSVNVPGFNNGAPRASIRESAGLVASLVVNLPTLPPGPIVDDAVLASAAERIARSIGRDTDSRLAALRRRVHPSVEV